MYTWYPPRPPTKGRFRLVTVPRVCAWSSHSGLILTIFELSLPPLKPLVQNPLVATPLILTVTDDLLILEEKGMYSYSSESRERNI